MAQSRFRRTRAFCTTFLLTSCLLLFGGGLLLADVNTRAVVFGDSDIVYAVDGGDLLRGALGDSGEDDPSPLQSLMPARLQALSWILTGERIVLGWLLPF